MPVYGQEAPATYRHHFGEVISLDFKQAESYLNSGSETDITGMAYRYHLAGYRDFLKVFLLEEEAVFEEALERREEYLDFWEAMPEHMPEREYFQGDTYLIWALLRLKFDQKFRAAIEMNKAYRLLRSTLEKNPAFIPAKTGMGVMEVFIGTVPERYQWVLSILNFRGSVSAGKQKMQEVLNIAEQNSDYAYLRFPTLFMRSFIDMNLSDNIDTSIVRRLEKLDDKGVIAEQPLLIFLYGGLLQKQQQNEKALSVLNYYSLEDQDIPFYYLYYMKGQSQLYAMNEDCVASLRRFTNLFKGRHYLKAAYQKIAWHYLIEGDTAKYHSAMKEVVLYGEAVTGADEQALQEAKSDKVPSVRLLKSRLLFDGGYYQKALHVLQQEAFVSENAEEQTELDYRQGRIFHKMRRYEDALEKYEKAYRSGKDLKAYYAANSMLMAGRIYLEKGNITSARSAFKQCLDLSGFQYQYAIHQKAKAGLTETEND